MPRATIWFLIVAACALAGCRSIRATYVGEPRPGGEIGGLPIVVKTPRYLMVTYKTVTWRAGTGDAAREEQSEEIETEPIEVGDVYALDVERPAAGTADYAIDLAQDRYYPTRVAAKVDDKTLATAATGIEKLADKIGSPRERDLRAREDGGRVRESVDRIEIYALSDLARPIAVWRR